MWPLMWPHLFCSVLFCLRVVRHGLLDSPVGTLRVIILISNLSPCFCVASRLAFGSPVTILLALVIIGHRIEELSHVDAVAYWPILIKRKRKLTRQPARRILCPCSMYNTQRLKERESMLPCMNHITLYSTTIYEQDDSSPIPDMPSYRLLYSPERCAIVFSAAQAGSTPQTCDIGVA